MGDETQQTNGTVDGSTSLRTRASNSWANPRKRPRSCDLDPSAQLETTIDEDILRQTEEVKNLQSPKRMRVAEWPLKDSNLAAASDILSRSSYKKSLSPRQKRDSSSSTRPSRFIEGSMNDKASQRPPSLYIREEEAMERYASGNMEDVDMVYDAGIESNKPSSLFRFGKTLANAFNSVNVWQGFNGIWKEKEKENHAKTDKDVLKAKAELKYAELKKSGYKGTQTVPTRLESQEVPAINLEDANDSRRSSFRDSGIDVDEYRSSSDLKDSEIGIRSTKSLKPPPLPTAGHRSVSPFSDASSGRRSSMRFHKPSLEGLKKVKSQIHLPSSKRHTDEVLPAAPVHKDDAAVPGLRREVSKKDIAKQYKLSKKVSDLENKLEIARRELELSIQEAPPVPDLPARIGRKMFVPGALASLPSERLLTPQIRANDGTANRSHAESTSTSDMSRVNKSTDDKGDKNGEHKAKVQDDKAEAAKQALWNKRASDIAARNAAARRSKMLNPDTGIADVLDSEVMKGSVSKRKEENPRKSQEVKVSGSHDSSGVNKRPLTLYVKPPHNSPVTSKDEVPPVPAKRTVFDPTKVNQASIMAMRAIPDSHAAFGKAWDDLKNLRKAYPDASQPELEAYISRQLVPKKVTDHTSVSHGDRPSSPFLDRPVSTTSPMKTRARASRRGISPPPPSVTSAKKFHKDLGAEKSPTPVNQKSPQADEETDDFATDLLFQNSQKALETAQASLDKPLPPIKADEFEWDDDVF